MLDGVQGGLVDDGLPVGGGQAEVKGRDGDAGPLIPAGDVQARLQSKMIDPKTGNAFHSVLLCGRQIDMIVARLSQIGKTEKQRQPTKNKKAAADETQSAAAWRQHPYGARTIQLTPNVKGKEPLMRRRRISHYEVIFHSFRRNEFH